MTRDFLLRDDYNVVVVDWGAGAQTSNYIAARNRVGAVGNVVARMIDFLDAAGLTSFDKVNIVGHSLGGHVAGFAGKGVTRGRINAIFATDPAVS
jgi:pancreatic triacylglycerol lipase